MDLIMKAHCVNMKQIGSTLLNNIFKENFYRTVKDKDFLCLSTDLSDSLYDKWVEENKSTFFKPDVTLPEDYIVIDSDIPDHPLLYIYNNLNENEYNNLFQLFLIKSAHKHFYLGKYKKSFKHLLDYSFLYNFFKDKKLNTSDEEFISNYNKYLIEKVYNNDERLTHFPNLNKNKSEFFNDKVVYHYDHDFIHELVAIEDKPAYTKCLDGEVKFSNKKFEKLNYNEKVNMVLEESFVIALERCLIRLIKEDNPYVPAYFPDEAFKYALTRVSTNLTSGPFRDFAANNFLDIYNNFKTNHRDYYKIDFIYT